MAGQTSNTKFKPGQSGNPKGKPKRAWTVAGLIEEAMEAEAETGVPYKKAVYTKLVSMARAGDIMAIKEVNQRLDGMPKQAVDVNNSGSLEVKWKDADRS
jgi:hypothetical protein